MKSYKNRINIKTEITQDDNNQNNIENTELINQSEEHKNSFPPAG
jgi:hypothetical protein